MRSASALSIAGWPLTTRQGPGIELPMYGGTVKQRPR